MLELKPVSAPAAPDSAAIRFSRETACRIAGLPLSGLKAWERQGAEPSVVRVASFGIGGIVALCVLRELYQRQGRCSDAFVPGFEPLFHQLAACSDIGWMATQTAIVSRDTARLCALRTRHVRCDSDQFVVVPLRPLIDDLKDRVFS
jgi:hypothetical protein